jgi:hypothetical protein
MKLSGCASESFFWGCARKYKGLMAAGRGAAKGKSVKGKRVIYYPGTGGSQRSCSDWRARRSCDQEQRKVPGNLFAAR